MPCMLGSTAPVRCLHAPVHCDVRTRAVPSALGTLAVHRSAAVQCDLLCAETQSATSTSGRWLRDCGRALLQIPTLARPAAAHWGSSLGGVLAASGTRGVYWPDKGLDNSS